MKRMLYVCALACALFLISGCQKEEPEVFPCERDDFGTICITNANDRAITVWFDFRPQGGVQPGQERCIKLVPGNVFIQAAETQGSKIWETS